MSPTHDERLQRIEDKIDNLDGKVGDLRVSVEHRVTKLEVKAGFWGAIAGALTGLGTHFWKGAP